MKAVPALLGSAVFLLGVEAAHALQIETPTGTCVLEGEDALLWNSNRNIYDADSCMARHGTWRPRNTDGGVPEPPKKPDAAGRQGSSPVGSGSTAAGTARPPASRPAKSPDTDVPEDMKKCRAKPNLPGC